MIDVCLLGTGGMLPLHNRYLTSLYLEYNGHAVLVDCGEGTQMAIAKFNAKLSAIDTILITHNHADHVTGLPGLLLSLGNCSRTEPLNIYAPKSCERVIRGLMSVCGYLPYEVNIHTFKADELQEFTLYKDLKVKTIKLAHSVECVGYNFELNRLPAFDPVRARALGIDVKYWKQLHRGETVEIDGSTYTTSDVTSGGSERIKITYTTDSKPLKSIIEFAKDSNLFICEGMYGDLEKRDDMDSKGHMLMQSACELATKANVGELWLTHYSPAEMYPQNYKNELKRLFSNSMVTEDGQWKTFEFSYRETEAKKKKKQAQASNQKTNNN